MAGIDEDRGLRAGRFGEQKGHAPVGNVGVVEGGFERFVFDEQALAGLERGVNFAESFFEEADAGADALRAGVVGAVGEPGRNIARAKCIGYGNTIDNVANSAAANGGIGSAYLTDF